MRRGRVLAESPRAMARLALPGRPEQVNFRLQRKVDA
jgi:cytosine deaminase